ncbi:ribonuclease D [Wolbachia endosymbiont of Howardula sp.]|uniref:ribonuclease D n=1 Tax=Wolbachia endosymbiont of Howardula sp. TaxID=2916816 RepID=UPI00217DC2BC|nr:ribonuclease D [Wolbachia endosymbiont of Howardula sp.]UWI82977.1 ribonuclease D [Wolbachia endosymbiont of Howardula sp.]
MIINTTAALENICQELISQNNKFIAIDTEFIRNNITYYPILSLIQISFGTKSFIVDALAHTIDLSAIKMLMLSQNITKVFHSCRQDIESLFTIFKCIPRPIFDTQIAAMFCDYYYEFVGYSQIVKEYQGISLDKIKAKHSNWLQRPLSQDQLDYALNDVIYLYHLYQILFNKLVQNNRIIWFQEEMESLSDINQYMYHPKHAWKRLKCLYVDNSKYALLIKSVIEWQETLAQRYNINRNKIINHAILRGFIEHKIENINNIIHDIKKTSHNIKDKDLLELVKIFNHNELISSQSPETHITCYDKSILDILSIILEGKCQENNISRKLVVSKNELSRSISGNTDKVFKGWRYNFFGSDIESFLSAQSKFEISATQDINETIKLRSFRIEN